MICTLFVVYTFQTSIVIESPPYTSCMRWTTAPYIFRNAWRSQKVINLNYTLFHLCWIARIDRLHSIHIPCACCREFVVHRKTNSYTRGKMNVWVNVCTSSDYIYVHKKKEIINVAHSIHTARIDQQSYIFMLFALKLWIYVLWHGTRAFTTAVSSAGMWVYRWRIDNPAI